MLNVSFRPQVCVHTIKKRKSLFIFSQSSFARHMCAQGFDTWTMEVRGSGLSTQVVDIKDNGFGPTSNVLCENLVSFEKYGADDVLASQSQSFSGQSLTAEPEVMSHRKMVNTGTMSLTQGILSPQSEGKKVTD